MDTILRDHPFKVMELSALAETILVENITISTYLPRMFERANKMFNLNSIQGAMEIVSVRHKARL